MENQRRKRPDRPRRSQHKAPDVNYAPPAPINRQKLTLQILTVAAAVIAFFACLAVFFRVDMDKCQVSGCNMYQPYTVFESSGIRDGDSLLLLDKTRAAARIHQALPYVQSVEIQRVLPDTLLIRIVEVEITFAVQDAQDNWWLISQEGRVLERASSDDHPHKLLGFRLDAPAVGQQANALEETSDVPQTYTNAQRLSTAIELMSQLKKSELLGNIASIDVEKMGNIQLWYGSRFQIKLGDSTRISRKIENLAEVVSGMASYQSGVLDISMKSGDDVVDYIPF